MKGETYIEWERRRAPTYNDTTLQFATFHPKTTHQKKMWKKICTTCIPFLMVSLSLFLFKFITSLYLSHGLMHISFKFPIVKHYIARWCLYFALTIYILRETYRILYFNDARSQCFIIYKIYEMMLFKRCCHSYAHTERLYVVSGEYLHHFWS